MVVLDGFEFETKPFWQDTLGNFSSSSIFRFYLTLLYFYEYLVLFTFMFMVMFMMMIWIGEEGREGRRGEFLACVFFFG